MTRDPLRRDLTAEVTARVLDGRLPENTRVNEVRLAGELGVSRTPLREALIGLADQGLLVSAPGRGFLVPPLDLEEARRLYPLVAELEALAVRWTALQDLRSLTGLLDECSDEMDRAVEAGEEPSELDDRWHGLLLSRCANPQLLRLIAQTKPLLKRYEVLYFGGVERARESIGEHRRVSAAIRDGDLAEATKWLVQNWVKASAYLGAAE
ncbi:GntR family transcriptional regulator [Amycolatopsis anabasis]|uniref:GntR family transcriptional regulator n=1 Tax=Amycolatopsis anabasis TaxID=1840409 RepID=UPI00131A718B|nr:GntR family transcriptional regulator [Amycolatopsis anabasis]